MGQVPIRKLIVGDGRLAKTLSLLFPEALHWSRKSSSESLSSVVQRSEPSHIWLAVSDNAIPTIIKAHRSEFANRTVVHFAGSLPQIENVFSAHPLSTFSGAPLSEAEFAKIPFVLDLAGPGLSELLPSLKNPVYRLASEHRAYYHALCTISGNFTVLLWESVSKRFETELGIPAKALESYREQIFKNLATATKSVLTGPIARGDIETVKAHQLALMAHAEAPLLKIYDGFADLYRTDQARTALTKEST